VSASSGAPRPGLRCSAPGVETPYSRRTYENCCLGWRGGPGVTKRAHAHALRHTFAVELAREGVPMPLIQQLLGHSSLAVTSVYLASLSPEEALDAVRNREW
jgi:integrase